MHPKSQSQDYQHRRFLELSTANDLHDFPLNIQSRLTISVLILLLHLRMHIVFDFKIQVTNRTLLIRVGIFFIVRGYFKKIQ